MLPAIEAAVCMIFVDILSVMMVQAEARDRGWAAGFLDAGSWLFNFATLRISLVAADGHTREVLLFVSIANILGARMGVFIGKRLIQEPQRCTCCKIHHVANF